MQCLGQYRKYFHTCLEVKKVLSHLSVTFLSLGLSVHAFGWTGQENIIPTCRSAGNYYIPLSNLLTRERAGTLFDFVFIICYIHKAMLCTIFKSSLHTFVAVIGLFLLSSASLSFEASAPL